METAKQANRTCFTCERGWRRPSKQIAHVSAVSVDGGGQASKSHMFLLWAWMEAAKQANRTCFCCERGWRRPSRQIAHVSPVSVDGGGQASKSHMFLL